MILRGTLLCDWCAEERTLRHVGKTVCCLSCFYRFLKPFDQKKEPYYWDYPVAKLDDSLRLETLTEKA